ncbi:peptidase S8 [Metabacillus arenae]|uniref:S8 family serine peptidase n=1 Tax=Metabacillus arenae TaxID=2771434 RepID=A0A926S010_9BACI|nr:peptidase S8 [Metabacillus arenae]MBD1383405.1 S8 family serine peptidase [Metabacillus arenae]
MRNKKISSLLTRILVCMLIFSLFVPNTAGMASETSIGKELGEATSLTKGKEQNGVLEQPEQAHWYKIAPKQEEILNDSHMNLKVKSDNLLTISVYSSKEKAEKGETFDQFRADTAGKEETLVRIPHAWDGPYYIKVQYLGEVPPEETLTNGADSNNSQTKPKKAEYTVSYEGIKIQPSDMNANEQAPSCPVEVSMDDQKAGKEILSQLRTIRDQLLNKTEEGKKLSDLYYKTAPFLVSKLIVSKEDRNSVYKNLVTLKPLFEDVAENGTSSSHTISEKEQQAINNLYDVTIKSVPGFIKDEVEKLDEKVGLRNLEGKSAGDLLTKHKLSPLNTSQSSKVIFKLKDGKSLNSVQKEYGILSNGLSIVEESDELFDDMYSIEVPGEKGSDGTFKVNEAQVRSTVDLLAEMPEVEFAEPVKKYRKLSNDIQYPYQWPLNNKSQDGGTTGADIKYEPMKNLLDNRKLDHTLIAVVDTGVDSTLADLKDNVRTDLGRNFVARNNNAMDDQGHGTHVAGIIAAENDNGYSMTGLNPNAQIIPVKVLDSTGAGDTEQIALGIKHAVDKGAKVINLSLGGQYSRVIEYALKYAASKNVTVAAASGNDGAAELGYPASSRYVISVGASNKLDVVAEFSNYGKGLDIVAPGSDIPSLLPDGNVTYMSGTSMAAPYVSAAAGILISQDPNLKPKEVEKVLGETADDISFESVDGGQEEPVDENGEPISDPKIPGIDWLSGNGRLNAFHAASALDLNVSVNKVYDNQNTVTGTAKEGTKVQVKSGDKLLGRATAGTNGKFTVKIPVQKKNQVIHVKGSNGPAQTSVKTVVKEGLPLAEPEVNPVTIHDAAVTGKAISNSVVSVKNKSGKVLATAKADSKGTFSIKIPKQKAGTVLYVTATDSTGKESKQVKVVVEN